MLAAGGALAQSPLQQLPAPPGASATPAPVVRAPTGSRSPVRMRWRSAPVTDHGPSVYVAAIGSSAVDAFDRSPPPYDVDGDGEVAPLTDGLLQLRYEFGFRDNTLISGVVDLANCTRCTADEIEAFIDALLD